MSIPERGSYDVLAVPGVPPPVLDTGATDRLDGGVREPRPRIYELYKEDEKTKKSRENELTSLAKGNG